MASTARKLRLVPADATLIGCAASSVSRTYIGVHEFCRAVARVEGRSPVAVRFWLAKLWGEGLVECGSTRPTDAGWAEIQRITGRVAA